MIFGENSALNFFSVNILFPAIQKYEFVCKGGKIPKNEIVNFLKQKKTSNIKLKLETTSSVCSQIGTFDINSEALKKHFNIDLKSKSLLNADVNVRINRIKIIQYATDFLRKIREHSKIRQFDKVALVRTLFRLWPQFEKHTEDVVLGYIEDKIKNDRKVIKKLKEDSINCSKITKTNDQNENSLSKKVHFLKYAHPIDDKAKILSYLKETLQFRLQEMKKNENLNIKEDYPIFIHEPRFVSNLTFSFLLNLFPNIKNIYLYKLFIFNSRF